MVGIRHCCATQPPPTLSRNNLLPFATSPRVLPCSAPAVLDHGFRRLSINGCNNQHVIETVCLWQSKPNPLIFADHVEGQYNNELETETFSSLSDSVQGFSSENNFNMADFGKDNSLISSTFENQKRSLNANCDVSFESECSDEAAAKAEVLNCANVQLDRAVNQETDKDVSFDQNCAEPQPFKVIDTYLDGENSIPDSHICKVKKNCSQNSSSLFGGSDSHSQPLSDFIENNQESSSNQGGGVEVDALFSRKSVLVPGPEYDQMGIDNHIHISENTESKNIFTDTSNDTRSDALNGKMTESVTESKCMNGHFKGYFHTENKTISGIQSFDLNTNDDSLVVSEAGHCSKSYESKPNVKLDSDYITSSEPGSPSCKQMTKISLKDDSNEWRKATSFLNIQPHGRSVSFDDNHQCDENVLNKVEENDERNEQTEEENVLPHHKEASEGKKITEKNSDSKTSDDSSFSQNGSSTNEVVGAVIVSNYNLDIGSESEQYVRGTDIPHNSQQCFVITPEILSSQRLENKSHAVSFQKCIELTFSPLYTQDCSDKEEALSSTLMKFSPLINPQTADGNSMIEKQLQQSSDFYHTELEQKILMQSSPNHSQLESKNDTSLTHDEESKTDGRNVNSSNETMNEENKTSSRYSNLISTSINLESNNHGSCPEPSGLVVFSPPLVSSSYHLNSNAISDKNVSQTKQGNFVNVASQIVPNYDTDDINNTNQTICNNSDCYVEANVHKNNSEITSYQTFKVGIPLNDKPSSTFGFKEDLGKKTKSEDARNDFDKDDHENAPIHNGNYPESQEGGVLEETMDISGLHGKVYHIVQQNALQEENRHVKRDSHCNFVDEQMVPENSFVNDHEKCQEGASFYDERSVKSVERTCTNMNMSMRPYHSSFQWQSVNESVLVNEDNNVNVQITSSRDHLKSITPLPSPLKRPRPLRIGLSKRQKVSHLHDHLKSITPLPSPLKRPRPLRIGLSKRQKVSHLHGK